MEHSLRAVRSDDEGPWGGAANCREQGSDAGAEVEDSAGRLQRQRAYQMDAGGVYRGCPPLLVSLSGRRIVGGEQLDRGSRRQSHGRIKRSKEVRGGEGCSDHD